MRIEVNMAHSHLAGWAPKEIGLFIDSHCRDGKPLAVPGELTIGEESVRLSYTSTLPLQSAALHYTTDTGLRSKRAWKSLPAKFDEGTISAPKPPAEANTWFINLTDTRNASVTSQVQFSPMSKGGLTKPKVN
jgi:hypothetical protein